METRTRDRLSDKRTIAEKFCTKEQMRYKTIKTNPKYQNIQSLIDTGASAKNKKVNTDRLINKRRNEAFKRIKSSTLVKIIESQEEKTSKLNSEINENNSELNDENYSDNTNLSQFSSLTYNTELLGNLNNIDSIILDLREVNLYKKCHIKSALSYPFSFISQDKILPEMIVIKNKKGKMIIIYHNDERIGSPYAQLLTQKGYDNIFFLNGGFEDFCKFFPEFLEGSDKDKYIEEKNIRLMKEKAFEEKKKGKKNLKKDNTDNEEIDK